MAKTALRRGTQDEGNTEYFTGCPIGGGFIWYGLPDKIPSNCRICDNSTLAISQFAKLYEVMDGAWGKNNNIDGSVDANFITGTGFGFSIQSIVQQPDGKLVVGGDFTSYNGATVNYIVRLNTDGSRDTSFVTGTGFNAAVQSIIQQSDGKLVVGGNFTSYNGATVNRIVRLNTDGSIDSSFVTGTGFNQSAQSIIQQSDGKLVVGGSFTSYNAAVVNNIVRLNTDGSRDTSFVTGTGFNALVRSIIQQPDGKLVVGGDFSSYNAAVVNNIVRLNTDGSRDTSLVTGTGFNSSARSIIQQSDGKLVVVGNFSSYNGITASRIVRLNTDGSRDTSLVTGTGFDSVVTSIIQQSDGKFVVVGNFTSYNAATVNRIVRLNTDGSIDSSFVTGTGFDNPARLVIQQSDGKLVVGGSFTSYNAATVNRIVRFNSELNVNLPDLRGRFPRGVDGGAGNDPDRASRTSQNIGQNTGDTVGSVQNDAMQNLTGTFSFTDDNTQTMNARVKDATGSFGAVTLVSNPIDSNSVPGTQSMPGIVDFDASRQARTSTEHRPKNANVYFVIRVS